MKYASNSDSFTKMTMLAVIASHTSLVLTCEISLLSVSLANRIHVSCSAVPFYNAAKVRKKAKIRNRYNQVPHRTRDTLLEIDKNTRTYHTQESQEVSLIPAGDHKAARNRQDSITLTKTNTKHK